MSIDRFDRVQQEILKQQNNANFDHAGRIRLLKRLENLLGPESRLAVYYSRPEKSLSQDDILPFAGMLKSIGKVKRLDLVVVSNGGDGTAAEKMLDLCRRYCSEKLRVVVPLYAKSAATLLALGADEIVMGETSELGPIDAQVIIIQDNAPQQVSADHFLRARSKCTQDLSSTDQATREAAQISLSLLSPAFLTYCEDLMNYGKDFARRQLESYMFSEECKTDPEIWRNRIDKILQNLTLTSRHLLHGRKITADDMQKDDDLKHLKVCNLSGDNEYWLSLTELLLRTEVVAQLNNIGKMVFATNFYLSAG